MSYIKAYLLWDILLCDATQAWGGGGVSLDEDYGIIESRNLSYIRVTHLAL